MRDVVRTGPDSGDDALPCGLVLNVISVVGFSPPELPELMDGDCNNEDLRGCLRSLKQINCWLIGYRPTLAWLERLSCEPHEPVRIVHVGCGGGDLLR